MIPRPGARDEASTQRTRCDSHWLRCHGQRVPGEAAGPVSTQMISAEYDTTTVKVTCVQRKEGPGPLCDVILYYGCI